MKSTIARTIFRLKPSSADPPRCLTAMPIRRYGVRTAELRSCAGDDAIPFFFLRVWSRPQPPPPFDYRYAELLDLEGARIANERPTISVLLW